MTEVSLAAQPRAARAETVVPRGGPCFDEGHPLQIVDQVVREGLAGPAARATLDGLGGSAPLPERVLRSLLLQVLYAIDCERRLLEQLGYDLRFRWFCGLAFETPIWSRAEHAALRDGLLATPGGRRLIHGLLRDLRPIALTWPERFRFDERIGARWHQPANAPSDSADEAAGRGRELLRSAGLPATAATRDARLLRVLERILMRICSPGLNGDRLAADVGMSRRALFYLFDAHGLTPATAIRNMRLDHCRRLLEDSRHRREKITTIALDHGFGNVSTFSRSFKQRYGVGPRQCRVEPHADGG